MTRIRASHAALAVCGIALTMAVGCTRHGLTARATDGAIPSSGLDAKDAVDQDLPTDPQVEAWEAGQDRGEDLRSEPGAEAGPEAGPEAEREAGLETGLDRSSEVAAEVGSEVGSETGAEGGTEAGSESGTEAGPPACTASSQDARVLAELNEQAFTSALALSGDTLFIGMQSPGTATGAIVAVSLSTGAQKTYSVGANIATQIVAVPGAVFYSPGKIRRDDAGAYNYEYTDIARLDLASGKVSTVDSSSGSTSQGVGAVVGNANGDVFWSILDGEPAYATLKRWNEATLTPETIMTWGQMLVPLVDRDHFYWSELTSSRQVMWRSMPLAGGEVTQLYQSSSTFPDTPTLAALDDQRLYYYFYTDSGAGIMAMPKDGGEGQTVVPNTAPLVLSSHSIDDTHVYWTDHTDQATIRRVPKIGNGEVEIFWSTSMGWVSDIAVDACNVYWAKYNPTEIMVRTQ
jgi:hypothetical protein